LDVCNHPYTNDLDCTNDNTEEDHGRVRPIVRCFVRLHLNFSPPRLLTDHYSASVATLIRVKYLVELGTYDDILCMFLTLSDHSMQPSKANMRPTQLLAQLPWSGH